MIDSAFDPTSTAKNHDLPGREAGVVTRKLNDGREFRIVKIFWEPRSLAARLETLGWSAALAQTPNYFIHGEARPRHTHDDGAAVSPCRRRRTRTAHAALVHRRLVGERARRLVPPDRAAFTLLLDEVGRSPSSSRMNRVCSDT